LPDRYWVRVVVRDACWEWTGRLYMGYGRFQLRRKRQPAHRWAYEMLVGAIPPGLTIDHLCRNRACVNPLHLEPVTSGENVRRGLAGIANSSKSQCKHGHALEPENTYIEPKTGWRKCRACRQIQNRDRGDYQRTYRLRNLDRIRAYDREWQRRRRGAVA